MTGHRHAQAREILFIGRARADFDAIALRLSRERPTVAHTHWEYTLPAALLAIGKKRFDAILLDVSPPDGRGLDILEAVQAAAPSAPILVIADAESESVAKAALKGGACDYLIKGRLETRPLAHALEQIIERKSMDETLFAEKERAEVTLNSIGDAVLCTDNTGRVTYLNLVAERMTGWSREDAAGHPASEIFHVIDGATRERIRDPLELAIRDNEPMGLAAQSILIRADGFESAIEDSVAPIHDRSGKVTGAVVVFHDVSEARAVALKMSHLAQYDYLTDLPNRMLFGDRVSQAIALGRRHQRRLAVLFLDCDNFKRINDTLGHNVGDFLLQSFAKRLVSAVRSSDTVSRVGGDEFVILLSELESVKDAALCARKILRALATPHRIGQHQLQLTASIGLAVYPTDARNPEALVKCADLALYDAKARGGNNCRSYRPSLTARATKRQSVEGSLLGALEREEFCLYYQPRVSLETGAIGGVEALIRWKHPERGLIPPEEFVPIAEESGLIVPIGRWVLQEACRQAMKWRASGAGIVPVAVNVSAVELRATGFLEGVTKLFAKYPIGTLEMELTESVLLEDTEVVGETFRTLTDLGVVLTLDDFGTGFSSLSYLRRFPFNGLKIDRSFVQEIASDASDRALVAAVISMGKSLGKAVVAEGIETESQLKVLRELGCGEGQGYYFCRPLRADDLATYLVAARRRQLQDEGIDSAPRARAANANA